jgi:hypothetical protein
MRLQMIDFVTQKRFSWEATRVVQSSKVFASGDWEAKEREFCLGSWRGFPANRRQTPPEFAQFFINIQRDSTAIPRQPPIQFPFAPISATKSLQISFVCHWIEAPPPPTPVSRLFQFILFCICMWLRNNRSFPPLRKNRSFNFPTPSHEQNRPELMSIAQNLAEEETRSPWTSLDVRIFRSFS